MEIDQEEIKVEKVQNDVVANESKCEKPVSNDEEDTTKQKVEEPSKELLQKIKNQIEVLRLNAASNSCFMSYTCIHLLPKRG